MYKRTILILGFLVFFSSARVHALSETTALVAGTAVSTATTFMVSGTTKKATLFAFMELISVYLFLQYTPENRYAWAVKTIDLLSIEPLFVANMEQESISTILQDAGCETYELPLVNAFLRLQCYDKQLEYILQELQKALSDSDSKANLVRKITELMPIVKSHLKRIRVNEAFVKNQKNWLDQWKLYQERMIIKQQLDHYDYMLHHAYRAHRYN